MSDKLPSKGYSVPRSEWGLQSSRSRFCQNCSSTQHWTYQCQQSDKNSVKKPANRLSPSQMLRLGIKRKFVELVPEMTEKERFATELKAVELEIAQEIKEEKQQQQQQQQQEQKQSRSKEKDSIKTEDMRKETKSPRDSSLVKQEIADPTEYPEEEMPRTRRRH